MIKSSKITLKYGNRDKLAAVDHFICKYQDIVRQVVDLLWDQEGAVPKLFDKSINPFIETTLSARVIQSAAKQASAVVRGTKQKQKRRIYTVNQLRARGEFKKARKLQKIIDSQSISKPFVNNINPELDSRFIKLDLDNKTSFDGWITIASLGDKFKFKLPFKRTKHFNKMFAAGNIKTGVRLTRSAVIFMFDLVEPEVKFEGEILGIDIGLTTLLSCSDRIVSGKDIHGHDLDSICKKLARRKRGSKGFRKAQTHRDNYINASVNQLNLASVRQVNLENLKHLRYKKKISRYVSGFTYRAIADRLEAYCISQGVLVKYVNPTYTSQRCSCCGWVRKSNRKGKQFKCTSCGYTDDADLNAALNISLELVPITNQQRLSQKNRKGFYWLEQVRIVPAIQNHLT